jgi:hypothetical protein
LGRKGWLRVGRGVMGEIYLIIMIYTMPSRASLIFPPKKKKISTKWKEVSIFSLLLHGFKLK